MVRGRVDAAAPVASGGGRWGDLRLRVLSAAVLVPVALICLWLGGWLWNTLVALMILGLAVEWRSLCARLRAGAGRAAALAAGLPYFGLPAAALVWLRNGPADGRMLVLLVVLVVWASDIGAYAVGRLVGGPKLAPAISPGKTWSGAAGGLIAAGLIGLAFHGAAGIAFACLLGIAAQLGDLLESGLKRGFGVKDSGRLIPGHGGLLDRLDGLLFAAPLAAALAALPGPAGTMGW